MKRFWIAIVIMLLPFMASANPPFSGAITFEQLLAEHDKFAKEYQTYQPSNEELSQIALLKGKQVFVLFGTWCHDSKREVPRFLKLLQQSKVQLKSLQLVAVGYDKRDPDGVAEKFKLKYTPTIIVLDGEKELARMVESPEQSLAIDLTDF